MYEIGTIGGLFDGAPLPPIDPSWLPPNTIQRPDGSLGPAPAPPSSSSPSATFAIAAGGGVVLGALVMYLYLRR